MDKVQKPPKIYRCKELEEPVCQEVAHSEKFDPRSYCHNILSKTGKVCRKAICRKFLKTNEDRTKGEIVCIPRPPCKLKRHFGPETEDGGEDDDEHFFRMFGSQLGLVLDEGTVSETDVLRGKFKGRERITRDGRSIDSIEYEEEIDENGNVIRRKRHRGTPGQPGAGGRMTPFGIVQDEETAQLLENLSKFLDEEGMATLAALGGAEICPCCRCTICECRLKGITSETLLVQRKKALLESKLRSWGKQGYAWSFDYFYKPDFEFFEKEREERIKREEIQAQELEKTRKVVKEESLDEEAEEGESVDKVQKKAKYVGVQAIPSVREHEIQVGSEAPERRGIRMEEIPSDIRGIRMEEIPSDIRDNESMREKWIGALDDEVPDFGMKGMVGPPIPSTDIPGSLTESSLLSRSMNADDRAISEYVRSTQRSSIESWVESREPFSEGRRPTTVTGASFEPIDIAFPSAEIQGPIRTIQQRKPKPVPKKKIKEEAKKMIKKTPIVSELDLQTPVLQRKLSDYEEVKVEEETVTTPGKAPVKVPLPTAEREETLVSSVELEDMVISDAKIDELSIGEAARAVKLAKAKSVTPSVKYGDVCNCLPGFCTCGAKHYVFKTKDVAIESKPSTEEKPTEARGADIDDQIEAKETVEEDASEKSSCICIHPWEEDDDVLRVTPAESSYMEQVRLSRDLKKKKAICTQPRFQQTLIIVKPEAVHFKDVILRAIKKEGLDIINERLVQLTPEQVAEVYCENYGSAYFPMFVQKMSSTPILVLTVAGNYAADRWKYIIGQGDMICSSWFYPESMKRRFGIHSDIYGAMRTSADFFTARNEIRYFFPLGIIEPIIIESVEVQDYCDQYIHPTLLKALYNLAEVKPDDPVLFLAEWLLRNNPFQPHYLDSLVALAST